MKKIIGIIIIIAGILLSNFTGAAAHEDDVFCAVYFTYIGCPNCAYTDPVVLQDWMEKYPNLVVIEYMWRGGEWEAPNSRFFGRYSHTYRAHAAVPQIVIDQKRIELGKMQVPGAKKYFTVSKSNPCLLLENAVFWQDLDISDLPAEPKIWANGRILISVGNNEWLFQWNGETLPDGSIGDKAMNNNFVKSLLFTDDINKSLAGSQFEVVTPHVAKFSGAAFPGRDFIESATFERAIKISLKEKPVQAQKPDQEQSIKSTATKDKTDADTIEIPVLGTIVPGNFSIPGLTVILAVADGLTNPCGFFVLFFLLSALLTLAGSRKKMIVVGGVFVFFFLLYYFLFMAVLLNIFMLGREVAIITMIAGGVCIFAGVLNVKDYFFFQKGLTISLSAEKKSRFEERVKKLSLTSSVTALIVGATIVASSISLVAIACTFGFPLAYTRILTQKSLPTLQYYLYLVLYNLIYIIPMIVIILIFAITLGKRNFGEIWMRILKLVSGVIILGLGAVLLWNYTLLENVTFLFYVVIASIIISGVIIMISLPIIRRQADHGPVSDSE